MSECEECGRDRPGLIQTGDRDNGPTVCTKCYFNPGWYRGS